MRENISTEIRHGSDDEIDLRKLFGLMWRGKFVIGVITFAAIVLAVIVALLSPSIYRAEAVLAPSEGNGRSDLTTLAAQYGGLASLAGLNLGSGSLDKTALGLEILKSRKFISEFIERRDILVPLMAAAGWDAETRELLIDADLYNQEQSKWVRIVKSPKSATPSMQEAHERFSDALFVTQDSQSKIVRVAVEHYSPDLAKQWVDWLIEDLNSSVMRRDVAEARQAIEYLEQQIEATSLSGLHGIFYGLIEAQTKTVMLASVTPEYVFRVIDPAVVPELRARPKRKLIVLTGALLGMAIGIAIVVIINRNSLRT